MMNGSCCCLNCQFSWQLGVDVKKVRENEGYFLLDCYPGL